MLNNKSMLKKYISPEVLSVDIVSSHIMLTLSAETGNAGVGGEEVDDKTPDLSAKYRGEWGNLWK